MIIDPRPKPEPNHLHRLSSIIYQSSAIINRRCPTTTTTRMTKKQVARHKIEHKTIFILEKGSSNCQNR
jgi:hypothetical protein